AFLDSLGTFEPKTLSDEEALTTAYAGAFDAYTLLDFADGEISRIGTAFAKGGYSSLDAVLGDLMVPLMYQRLAEAQIENTKAVFEVGRDLSGAKFDTKIDLQQVGDFFRRGAEANYAAFTTSGLVPQLAESNGISTDVVIGYLSGYDTNISIATHQQAVLPALEEYIGKGKPNAAYAVMGYGLNNYVRNQMLVEKYYNNAVLDTNYQLVGLNFAGALDNAIDLSRDQASSEISALRDHEVEPAISIAIYEAAPSNAEGGPEGKFSQLSDYSSGYVTSRLLSYLGAWKKK
ncbi:MAG: hypothetical protein J0H64_05285, partial [Actinobacteria bacterium]|nr:hypothetical protein [Actinomycetota bacterium]